ncbi:hypothetical protein AGMMS50230_17800 [Spirochaetia bacterium]|nr:hypothetical protein AGMMS50230_17800 [Spirochaetia bacterium]
MISFDYVDKKPMKDIIAAQEIKRRPDSSLLSTAMKYRVLPDNSFIVNQRLPKRKKNPILEMINRKVRADTSAQKPIRRKNPPGFRMPELSFEGLSPAHFHRGLPVLLCIGVVCLALIIRTGYIPDPEPPEARLPVSPGGLSGIPGTSPGDEIPLDLTEVFAWQSYTVVSGDSVEAIAKRFGLSLDAIIASNNLRNVRQLRAGEKIRIPNMDGIPYTVKSGDSYTKIAKTMDVPLEAVLDANDIQSGDIEAGTVLFIPGAKMDKNALRQALGQLFLWPISGRRTSSYGWRNDPFSGARSFHAGLDISAPTGTSVKVSSDGRVSATGYNAVYGNFIIITHSAEYQTMYAHLSKILVKNGVYVNQGAIIGQVGNTGRSTGPHLHFSVYKNKRAINPLEVLNK